LGHLKKSDSTPLRHLKEYRLNDVSIYTLGQVLSVEQFEAGQIIDVSGDTTGRGFAGYQKRHNFARGPMAHGSKNHRLPGSTGAGTTPGRVYPGKRMAGRLGGKQVTIRKLEVVKVDVERNLLLIKGALPGKSGALLNIRPATIVGVS
jgi:large subunit ribosomal protein L3